MEIMNKNLQVIISNPIIILLIVSIGTILIVSILIASIWYNKPKYIIIPEEIECVTFYYVEKKGFFEYSILFSTTDKRAATEYFERIVSRELEDKESKKLKNKKP